MQNQGIINVWISAVFFHLQGMMEQSKRASLSVARSILNHKLIGKKLESYLKVCIIARYWPNYLESASVKMEILFVFMAAVGGNIFQRCTLC